MARQPTPRNLTRKHIARLDRERTQERYLKIGAGVILALVIGLILFGILDQTVFQGMRPVAKVADQNISAAQFIKAVKFDRYQNVRQLQQIAGNPSMMQFFGSYALQIMNRLDSKTTVGQEVLDGLIEDRLVAIEAEKRGITITDEEVDREFEQAFGFFADGTPTPAPTETPFVYSTSTLSPTQLALVPPTATAGPTETLAVTPTEAMTATPEASATPTTAFTPTPEASPTIAPTATAFTRELFETEVSSFVGDASSIGYNRDDLRDFIRRQMLRRKVFEAITADVVASSEQVWARHILVPTEEQAQQVIDRLNAGEDFAALAAELSTDTSNKDMGGDLQWFTRERMVAPFSEAAFALEVGQVSQPVQTEFGWHIIQVLGKEERPLDPNQLQEAQGRAYQDWLEAAKTEAGAETFDRWLEIVPEEPEVPADIRANLEMLQSQQQQQLPIEP